MIPKIIHYCWYGKGEMNSKAKMCLKSWKKFCPDYEYICWNEENTDFSMNPYLKEAYEAKKYAFVTDYMRLYVLEKFGGFYMDTDVELLKSLDEYCGQNAFTGVQDEDSCVTGIIASEKRNEWIAHLLSYYDNRHFLQKNGSYDMTPNTVFITEYTRKKYGWEYSDEIFLIKNVFAIFPFEVFCCKDYETGYIYRTGRSAAIHHFNGSWLDQKDGKKVFRIRMKLLFIRLLGYPGYRKALNKFRQWRHKGE